MINFLKENFNVFIKITLYQFGSSVMGLMLAFVSAQSSTMYLISSIFSICFYLYLLYVYYWDLGAKDLIRIEGNRLEYKPLKGLWLALYCNIPNIIIGIIVLVFGLLGSTNGPALAWAANVAATTKVIGLFWEAMFMGFVNKLIPTLCSAFLIITAIPVLFSTLFYYMGLKNIQIIKKKQKTE